MIPVFTDTIDNLIALPGIGPKMGYLTLQCAWGKNEGIGVDVHVHRICQRLNWTQKVCITPYDIQVHWELRPITFGLFSNCNYRFLKPKNPEATRLQLESWLPKDRWREVNKMLVGFGQQICTAASPKCDECLNSSICPKNFSAEKIKRRKEKKK